MTTGLTVRLQTPSRDRHVTREVRDLSFRKTAPGGYASATIELDRPLSLTPAELQYYGTLFIYDGRNGSTAFEGRLEDLGRGASNDGQIWEINAIGAAGHAQDRTVPLIYQDQSLTTWQTAPNAPPFINSQQITTTDYGPGLQLNIPSGTVVDPQVIPGFMHYAVGDARQNVAVVTFHFGEDTTDANWQWDLRIPSTNTDLGSAIIGAVAFTAGSSTDVAYVIGTDFAAGVRYPYLALERVASTVTVPDDSTTASFAQITVRATMFTRQGAEITSSSFYHATPMASDVVADLLGRLLDQYDGAGATISTAQDYGFTEQLGYPNGTNADSVFTDLMTLLPGMYWAAWESNAAGKHRFEWVPWPTNVRYDATAVDGFDSPGSAEGIYNEVIVRWVDANGLNQTTNCAANNPILAAAGLTRTAYLDLGSSVAGDDSATQAGNEYLAENSVPPNAGTLTVTRPIYDRYTGHLVMPWEIDPGYLVSVRNVQPVTGTPAGRDGVTTFRIAANTYTQSNNAGVLELDSPAPTLSNVLTTAARAAAAALRN